MCECLLLYMAPYDLSCRINNIDTFKNDVYKSARRFQLADSPGHKSQGVSYKELLAVLVQCICMTSSALYLQSLHSGFGTVVVRNTHAANQHCMQHYEPVSQEYPNEAVEKRIMHCSGDLYTCCIRGYGVSKRVIVNKISASKRPFSVNHACTLAFTVLPAIVSQLITAPP